MPTGSAIIRQIHGAIAACFRANDRPLNMAQILAWIGANYKDSHFNPATIKAQVYGSCTNNPSAYIYRKDTPKILYFERSNKTYRLQTGEPAAALPDSESVDLSRTEFEENDQEAAEPSSRFAFEAHLRDYLVLHLGKLEKGLCLWSEAPPSVEYVLAGRRIDILAKDASGIPVVIELKLDRGYDRVIGQALLYQGLVAQELNLPRVRIILVAGEITEELRIASRRQVDVDLFEYELMMEVKKISVSGE